MNRIRSWVQEAQVCTVVRLNFLSNSDTEDTVRQLIKRGEHAETPGFQNFAVFCPLCIVRGTGVCRTHS